MGSTWVPVIEASTDAVPPAQRLEYWESHNASELIGLRCSSYAPDGLRARERNFDLGSVRLADIAGNEHVVERTLPIMRRHPKDSIFACMLLQGEAFFYQAGRCVPMHEGDLIVYGTTIPYLRPPRGQILNDVDGATAARWPRSADAPIHVETGLRAGQSRHRAAPGWWISSNARWPMMLAGRVPRPHVAGGSACVTRCAGTARRNPLRCASRANLHRRASG
jgi:hypothetical protein